MLDQLAQKYGTDKSSLGHNYIPHYEQVLSPLKEQSINLLEIGVRQGWSHQMWSDYFANGSIYGIDNCLESEFNADHAHLLQRGIKIFYGNQEDDDFLQKQVKTISYDIIIDDGGHKMREQQLSLLHLIGSVKSGGLYFIEDLHTCSIHHCYEGGQYPQDSTIILLNNLKTCTAVPTSFLSQANLEYIQSKILNVNFLKDNLALIVVK